MFGNSMFFQSQQTSWQLPLAQNQGAEVYSDRLAAGSSSRVEAICQPPTGVIPRGRVHPVGALNFVLTKLRKQVLAELHPGVVRMKSLARSHIWWPGMDREIEGIVRDCMACTPESSTPESSTPESSTPEQWPLYIHGYGQTASPWARD